MSDVSLRDRRQALLDRADLQGTAFCRTYAAEADAWLSGIAERATGGDAHRLALIAVGGYGRAELWPYSDLDVVLVDAGRRDVSQLADAIWYPVWDQGVHLDHAVRHRREMLQAARDDLRVALGLLDARLVWGDDKVSGPLLDEVVTSWRRELGARWLPELQSQMEERRRAAGEVAFLLEPDLKESHGGLRDVNVLRAVAAYAPDLAEHVDLASLDPAAEVLGSIRVELHRSAGRELDRLVLQDQDQVAARLGYADADALMAAVAEAGRQIAWVSDDAWRRRARWEPRVPERRRRFGRGRAGSRPAANTAPGTGPDRVLEPGIELVGGEVALASSAAVSTDTSLAFRLAAVAAEHDLPIARGSLHRLADKAPAPPDPWPAETREALVRLLLAGHPAIRAFEALDQHGLAVRLLPEWAAVRNKPQRNAYHRFTVDRHLLEAAANAAALVERVDRPDLLVVGTLLHDIGKGFPGDHTEVGIEVVGAMGARMGFSPADVAVLVAMVRYHLLLPDLATRRDLDDPETVARVVSAAGDPETVALLAAETEADSLATGPSAWGSWKAGLVAELAARAGAQLRGGAPGAKRAPSAAERHRAVVDEVRASGRPAVLLDPPRVVVAAPDRRGLLASVAGTLALHGLDVRSADVSGDDGVAIEVFTVEVGRGSWPDAGRLREDLEAVLTERLALTDRLAAKAAAYAGRGRPQTAHPVSPRVVVDNDASAGATVVEVGAADEIGLLHRVTQTLFDCDLDVTSARVSTIGEEVVDAFYVRDAQGAKVTDPAALVHLREALLAAVS